MKSLAEFKREAKSGELEGKMLIRYGSSDIPEKFKNWRRIVTSNSVSVFFQTDNGEISQLSLPQASLVEYDGDKLTVYYAGYRDLTAEEQRVMDGWKEKSSTPEFQAQANVDALTDGSSTYWAKVTYFRKAGLEYLMGAKEQRGMVYDYNLRQVRDAKIKGPVCMQYAIRKVSSRKILNQG